MEYVILLQAALENMLEGETQEAIHALRVVADELETTEEMDKEETLSMLKIIVEGSW